ncbi:FAD:protein FMN transferase [Levilactobacillus suantsaii]|uniref:FAD:protein FMN transferase n=1 Tax=Levilactobacillus suantsaii TaxID=2292255 RepID=A0A4Q0VHF2_9LACO|nr:FAD:protein FMN transferase [Levilactobacillus suantsaii]RXI76554.1 FAD:protein FMN transferase [Levilactobacillus suantsaii]
MPQATRVVHMMGTVITLTITHPNPDPILTEAVRRLAVYEHRFSANDDTSELMEIAHQAGKQPVQVDPELFDLIRIGQAHSAKTAEHLNIAIGPLVQTWRIGFDDARKPSDAEIQAALKLTDPQAIVLDPRHLTVYLKQSGMTLDLGAIAKGYIADLLHDYFVDLDVTAGLINLGGNVVVFGPQARHADNQWRIGIQDPQKPRGQNRLVLKVRDKSVVTSGIYERQLKTAGHTYHHVLDPQTGYPMPTDIASVTVISAKSITGELWTTKLFGQSVQDALALLQRTAGIEGVIITHEGQLYSSFL